MHSAMQLPLSGHAHIAYGGHLAIPLAQRMMAEMSSRHGVVEIAQSDRQHAM